MQDKPCERNDLLCEVPQWNKYDVDEDGFPTELWSLGDPGPDGDVDGYLCSNCGADFILDRSTDRGHAITLAWKEALAHLPKQGAQQ